MIALGTVIFSGLVKTEVTRFRVAMATIPQSHHPFAPHRGARAESEIFLKRGASKEHPTSMEMAVQGILHSPSIRDIPPPGP
jgi:hypothetical protein